MGRCLLSFLFPLALASYVCCQMDSCGSDLTTFLPSPFNASGLSCRPIWNSFILRSSQDQENILSVVLSTVYASGWVGIGFSNDGAMIGSSAMVGWIGMEGKASIRQYYLGGQSSSEVAVDEGNLLATNIAPAVVTYGANIYLAFQLKFLGPINRRELLFAYSTSTPTDYRLAEHDDRISMSFDFSSGTPAVSSYPYTLERNHAALAAFGWGILLPAGAIVARYCKERDPLWYHLHVIVQFAGFMIGLAGIVSGIALYDTLHSDVSTHRGLGIFVFVLVILQVIAFFVRPDKDSEIRRYWNWYHWWVGRLALLLASVNVVLGIHAGGAGPFWRLGYGVSLALILVTATVLEVVTRTRCSEKPAASPPLRV